MRTEFKLIVFEADRSQSFKALTTKDYHVFYVDNFEFKVSKEGSWIIPLGIGDKWINRIAARYMQLYRVPIDKKGKALDPQLIDKGAEAANSSIILWKVKKYRGVTRGIEDQFKEPTRFDVPNWAIIIVFIALIAAGIIMLNQLGYI